MCYKNQMNVENKLDESVKEIVGKTKLIRIRN